MSDLRVLPGGLSEPPITIGGMHISKQSIQDIADYATSQQAAGKPRSTVQMLLGHSDLSTTQRYLGKSSGQLRTAVSYAA